MNELHPTVLDDFGIIPLIKEELSHFHEETKVQIGLEADCPVRPPRDIEIVLYRICHEALINIRRHAPGARHVTVGIKYDNSDVSLYVEDDGPGFNVEAALQSHHVGGLMSMRRRAEIVGGTFEVMSTPGSGTRVTIRVSSAAPPESKADER